MAPLDVGVARAAGGELQVGAAAGDEGGAEGVVRLLEKEAHVRVVPAEGRHEVGHQPGAQRELEGEPDGPGLRVVQLVDGGQPVVQLVQQRVDVALEDRAGVGRPEHPARPVEEGSADLALEPGERARDAGLADEVDVGHLGHRRPVGHLLEPAQGLDLHSHDASAWLSRGADIGSMGRNSALWTT